MPLPRWLARFANRFVNPRSLRKESWPILTHVGRTTGIERRTPLGPVPFDGGFVFLINYDSTKADWVLNTMAAGRASLLHEGETHELVNPRLVSREEAMELSGGAIKPPPGWTNVEFMLMDTVQDGGTGG